MSGYNHLLVRKFIEEYKLNGKKVPINIISKESGIPKNTINTIKDGKVEPKANTLFRLAVYLGVTVNDFFEGMPHCQEANSMVMEPLPKYNRKQAKDDPWRIAYEQQKEISDLREQLAHSVNENAPVQGANVG